MDLGNLGYLLRSLGYSLPELIVLSIGFALLMEQRRDNPARRLGLIGVIVMLVATLLNTVLSLSQTMLFTRGDAVSDLAKTAQLLGGAMILLNIVYCGGLLTVIVSLRNATRRAPEHAQSHQHDNAQR